METYSNKMDKKKSKKQTRPTTTTPSKVISDETKRYITNLQTLAKLVKEILLSVKNVKDKPNMKNKMVMWTDNFISQLGYDKCKPEFIHQLFVDVFNEYEVQMLGSKKSTCWVYKNSIQIWLGKETRLKNKEYILPLSAAFNKAHKYREEIDKGEYDNENDREEDRGGYLYQYFDLLMSNFCIVMIDALGASNIHVPHIKKIQKYFRSKTTLKDNPHDALKDVANDTDSQRKMFNQIMGNSETTDRLKQLQEKLSDKNAMDDPMSYGNEIFDVISPTLSGLMGGKFGKKESESDDDSDSETVSESTEVSSDSD